MKRLTGREASGMYPLGGWGEVLFTGLGERPGSLSLNGEACYVMNSSFGQNLPNLDAGPKRAGETSAIREGEGEDFGAKGLASALRGLLSDGEEGRFNGGFVAIPDWESTREEQGTRSFLSFRVGLI